MNGSDFDKSEIFAHKNTLTATVRADGLRCVEYTYRAPKSLYFGTGIFGYEGSGGVSLAGGYNFMVTNQDRVTPLLGISTSPLFRSKPYFAYGLGIDYEHYFNNSFSMGLSAFDSMDRSAFAIGMPLRYRYGDTKKWEFCMSPTIQHTDVFFFSHTSLSISCSMGRRF